MKHWNHKDLARHRLKGAAAVRKIRKVNSIQKPVSEIEAIFDIQMRVEKLPAPKMNYQFDTSRGWMFDRAWPEYKLAVEIDGMAHRIKQRFESDIEKFAHALMQGWTVLHVSGKRVRDRTGVDWLIELMYQRGMTAKKIPRASGA